MRRIIEERSNRRQGADPRRFPGGVGRLVAAIILRSEIIPADPDHSHDGARNDVNQGDLEAAIGAENHPALVQPYGVDHQMRTDQPEMQERQRQWKNPAARHAEKRDRHDAVLAGQRQTQMIPMIRIIDLEGGEPPDRHQNCRRGDLPGIRGEARAYCHRDGGAVAEQYVLPGPNAAQDPVNRHRSPPRLRHFRATPAGREQINLRSFHRPLAAVCHFTEAPALRQNRSRDTPLVAASIFSPCG